ncbi:MAG: hypothetical protein PF692_08830 [Kiritimatiellae bacterium]|jgi:hypothetical protein|nr:hypothetical protein [Kiritimatiellia bacterium]
MIKRINSTSVKTAILSLFIITSFDVGQSAIVDLMDNARNFYQSSAVTDVTASNGQVTLKKIDSGDAFVRWSPNKPDFVPLVTASDRVEIDFAGFADNGSVDVVVVVKDAAGKSHNVNWLGNHDKSGLVVLESVRELARTNEIEKPQSFHLFFRIKNDPVGSIFFKQIRLSAKDEALLVPQILKVGKGSSGTSEIMVAFDKEPEEQGMVFDRGGVAVKDIKVVGRTETVWNAENPYGRGKAWQRSFRFDITDSLFVNGGYNSVDIEVTYMLNAWGSVNVYAATTEGEKGVGSMWGACEGKWKTGYIRLDNANFNNAVEGRFDLRLSGDNGPLALKRIRIIGYSSSEDVRWDRMLEVVGRKALHSAEAPLFVFHADSKAGLQYNIDNHAQLAPAMRYQLTVKDAVNGKIVHKGEGKFTPSAGTTSSLELDWETTNWSLGPYTAEVRLYLDTLEISDPVYAFTTLLGVISDTELEKARQGEFLFGLDPGGSPTSPEGLAFYKVMGVDLLRFGLNDSGDASFEEIRTAYDLLAEGGVSAMMMMDPPGQMHKTSEEERLKKLKVMLPRSEEIARKMADLVTYYEIGNEPDLPFFYPGSIDAYLDSFYKISDALRAGNPKAIVMNGGLCFFGEDGDRRARELIDKMNMEKLGIWAYHGHGAGGEAERDAYQRQVDAVTKVGKDTRNYLDTETGMPADVPVQYLEQSRTGVQKMVFAHAKGMPSMMWFRLFMGNEGYTLSHNLLEPRPTIMAYRTMVEEMRHVRFARMLDEEISDRELYLFDEIDEDGNPNGHKVLVAWANVPGHFAASIQLDASNVPIQDARKTDLYGNTSSARVFNGLVNITLSSDPIYLSWQSSGDSSTVKLAESPLNCTSLPSLQPYGVTDTTWTIFNSGKKPLQAELKIETVSSRHVKVLTDSQSLIVPPGQRQAVQVRLSLENKPAILIPRWWHVFTHLDPMAVADMEAKEFASIPSQLPGIGKPSLPTRIWTTDGQIDFASMAGGFRERKPALAFAAIEVSEDTELSFTAAADWWMRWYVNGEIVYDTFKGSGGPLSLDAHPFTLPLKKGRNIIAAQVLSGSAGFKLIFGGEDVRQTVLSGGVPPDRISAMLLVDDQVVAHQSVGLDFLPALPLFNELKGSDQLSKWITREPFAFLDHTTVINFHEAYPDSSRWYQGKEDVSAVAWLRDAGTTLDLMVAVRDDIDCNPPTNQSVQDASAPFDGVFVELFGEDMLKPIQFWFIRPTQEGTPQVLEEGHMKGAKIDVQQLQNSVDGLRTVYSINFPASSATTAIKVTVFDADVGILKQTLTSPIQAIVREKNNKTGK